MNRMSSIGLATATFAAIVALTGFVGLERSASRTPAGEEFVADLRGAQEVPPVETLANGSAKIVFNSAHTAATFQLTVNSGRRMQQTHIHCGPRGVNGPIILFLAGFHDRGWDVDGEWVANAKLTDANILDASCGATLREIFRSMQAGQTYANVHSVAHPGGEIRGQIRSSGD